MLFSVVTSFFLKKKKKNEIDTIIIPILQKRKLRHRVPNHIANGVKSQNLNFAVLLQRLITTTLCCCSNATWKSPAKADGGRKTALFVSSRSYDKAV